MDYKIYCHIMIIFGCIDYSIGTILCHCKNYVNENHVSYCSKNGTMKSPSNFCRIVYPSKWNNHSYSLRHYPYLNEINDDCPEITGICQNHSHGYFCCCKGQYCNKDIKYLTITSSKDQHIAYIDATTASTQKLDEEWQIDYGSIVVVVSIIVILLCLTFLIIWFISRGKFSFKFTITRVNKRFTKDSARSYLFNSLLKTETHEEMECFPNFGRLVSNKCTKTRLVANGRSSEIWLVNVVDESEQKCESIAKVFHKRDNEYLLKELAIYNIKGFHHENIAKFLGAFKYVKEDYFEYWLVLEYNSLGSVYDYLKSGNLLTKCELHRIVCGIADGVAFLHENLPHSDKPSLAHRDIKPHNILLNTEFIPKLIDFELTIDLSTIESCEYLHFQVGTRRYMAPELLDSYVALSSRAFQSIDVYAMALVVWELMSRCYWDETSKKSIENTAYQLAFESELGRDPCLEQLRYWIGNLQKRPEPHPLWVNDKEMNFLWLSIGDLWDEDAEARISASCFSCRIRIHGKNPVVNLIM